MIKKISYSQDDLMEDLLLKNQTEADGKSIPGTINEIIDNMNTDPSPVKSVANGNGMILNSSGKLMMNKSSTLTAGAMSKEDKIKLDGLYNYELPTASTDTLGGVKVDGTSITINQNGVISSTNRGKIYQNGIGIDVDNIHDTINAKIDNDTIKINEQGQLYSEKGEEGKIYTGGTGIEVDNQNDTINAKIDGTTIKINEQGQLISETKVKDVENQNGLYLDSNGQVRMDVATTLSTGAMSKEDKTKLDGLHNYELPTASTDTLGGVKVDGTSITINQNGMISSNSGSVDIQAGTGIEIDKSTTPNTISASIGTNDSVGIVKADGITTFLDPDGTISSKATLPNINAGYGIKIEYGKGHDLPEEYTELLFIRGKAGCYLDTGVNADYTTAFEVTAQRLANPSEAFNVFGAAATGNTAGVQFLNNNNARCYSGSAAANYAATITGIYFDTLTFYSDVYKRTITNTVTGEVAQNDETYLPQFDAKKNYYIGRINGSGVGADFTGRIYPILIWKDRNLVRYYVPAKKRDTQQIGLYDKVNNSFETSSTAAQFIEGPDAVPATTISTYDFTGATDTQAGYSGLVPTPLLEDKNRFLRGDGTWSDIPNITKLQNEIENLKNEIENLKK